LVFGLLPAGPGPPRLSRKALHRPGQNLHQLSSANRVRQSGRAALPRPAIFRVVEREARTLVQNPTNGFRGPLDPRSGPYSGRTQCPSLALDRKRISPAASQRLGGADSGRTLRPTRGQLAHRRPADRLGSTLPVPRSTPSAPGRHLQPGGPTVGSARSSARPTDPGALRSFCLAPCRNLAG